MKTGSTVRTVQLTDAGRAAVKRDQPKVSIRVDRAVFINDEGRFLFFRPRRRK